MNQTLDLPLLDQSDFRPIYVRQGSESEAQFHIEGAHCSRCLAKIEGTLKDQPGVSSARLDLGRQILTVRGAPDLSFGQLGLKVKGLGYGVQPIRLEGTHAAAEKKRRRSEIMRMGITGACAGNIMLLSISQYAGADKTEFDWLFGFLSFLIFLPVIFYGAIPFFRTFWNSLKAKKLSIEAPVTMAMSVGTVYSLMNLWRGSGETYFDSLAALIFLLLAARVWQGSVQRRLGSKIESLAFLDIFEVLRWNSSSQTFEKAPPESLKVGDKLRLNRGDRLPADARPVSECEIDMAIWTGESSPVKFKPAQEAYAGSTLVSESEDFLVSAVGPQSRLGQLLEKYRSETEKRGRLHSFVDQIGQWFTFIVLATAAFFVVLYWSVNPLSALERALALTLLACPCALAIATPLALARGIVEARRRGLIVKDGASFEAIAKIKDVVFDKTGTLTLGQMNLCATAPTDFRENPKYQSERDMIMALEKDSFHPIGRALVRGLTGKEALNISNREESGRVCGQLGGVELEVKTTSPDPSLSQQPWTWVGLFIGGVERAKLALRDEPRLEARDLISNLKSEGLNVHLLTGDRREVAENIAQEVGIPRENIRAEQTPENKLSFVKNLSKAMVVGDGVNDTLAMASSLTSVAVHSGMEASLKAADVYLAKSDLQVLQELFDISHLTMKMIYRNFAVASLYNVTGGALALMGYIHPLAAAVLMPLSSATLFVMTMAPRWRKSA